MASNFSPQVLQFTDTIREASNATGLPFNLIASLVQQESGGNARAESGAGAQGLTQLMPGTAKSLGVSNPFDPRQSIFGGARYLQQQISSFGSVGLGLAAYNAGPGAVRRAGGVPGFSETQNFVRQVSGRAGLSPETGLQGLQGSVQPQGQGVPTSGTQSTQSALQQSASISTPLAPQVGQTQLSALRPQTSALAPPEQRTPQIQSIAPVQVSEEAQALRQAPAQAPVPQPLDVQDLAIPQPPQNAAEGIERLGAQQEQLNAQLQAGNVHPTSDGSSTPGSTGLGLGVVPSKPGEFSNDGDKAAAAALFNPNKPAWQNLVEFTAQFGGNIQGSFQTTGGSHAAGSNHYAGRAIDLGDATVPQSAFQNIAAYAQRNPWVFKELYFDPLGWYIKDGQVIAGGIGGHGNHMHLAV